MCLCVSVCTSVQVPVDSVGPPGAGIMIRGELPIVGAGS